MPNPNDKVKNLYDTFVKDGYAMEPEAQFRENLKDPKKRKAAYDALVKDGYDMEPYAEFESNIGFAKASPKPQPQRPAAPAPQAKPQPMATAAPAQQKPKGTPMTEQDKIRMSLQMGQMKQQVQQGIANTNAKIGRMMEPLTQKGRERRRLGEFQARMAGTPTHVVGFNTASPAPAGSGARGRSQQKPVQSEQSPQPYGVKYENGKAKTQWILPDGTLTTSLIEANQAEYEARTARLAHQFQDRMKENGLDPNKPEDVRKQAQLDYEAPMRKAIEDEWQRAEAEDRAADEAYRKDMERAEGGGFWQRLKKSITPLGPDGMPLRRGDETLRDIKRAAKRQDTFNLEKMAQSVLQNMPQDYKDNQMLNYSRYFREHPSELKGRTVSQAAKEALQGEVYHATYERAVQARMPKSKTEFLLRKVADQPFFSQTISDNMAARLFSHSIGTEAADMDAMGRYGTDHRALDITGTVLNMAIDPTTYISGGVGSFAGKQALKLSGKVALKGASKEAAERYVGRTLAGRMVAGVAAGSANFGTFEGLKNMQQQMRLGGTLNPETGEYEFSAGDMLKATGHGMLLGSVTGTLSPVLGNVSDKLVKATESTAGKVGIRAGELMTSTVAEGTIFATPEWIENAQLADEDPRKRKAMDIWTDNMAMMLGFKVSHGIKSAPQVIAGLRPIAEPKTMEERNHNRRSFAERLSKRMDASPRDLDFTKEEREELRRNGYGDLASLFTRTPKQPNKPKAKPTMTDGKTMTFDVDYQHAEAERVSNPEFDGYEAMERLMQDPNVSQSARAKAYYILTGRMLPMGTVTGYTTNKDANGVTVQAMTAQGEVVTSRHFKTEEEAKKEEANIMRQAELNSVDVGERYKEAAANAKVVQAAVESVAPGADFATVMRNYKAVKEGDKDAIAAYGKMVEDIDRAIEANKTMADGERPEAIRASIKEETGVDVDATLRKEPKNRTEEEQAAVEDYIKRLFPEQKSEEAGASAEAEQPMSEAESAAAAAYDQARLLWDKVEKGDTDAKAEVDAITLRMQEAYQMCEDAFGADAEMRIAEINEDPWPLVNNSELSEDQQDAVLYYVNAKAAMEGVMDASNEAADGKRKEVEANVERHTHKDMGVVQPATMKVDDKPVYVVKGNVVMLPDGSGIDVRNSDQSIVICDAETGEYKFASPDQLFSLGEAIDPQTELDEAYANIQAEHEAVLGVPENGENVQGNGENVPNSAENVSQLTDEQLQQYAHSAFNEATQSNGITIPQEQAEQLQQHNQQMLEQEQQRKEEEANRQPTALERVPINEETGEPMFEKADRETALDALNEVTGGNDENTTAIVRAQVEQATKALEALKKKKPTKKAPSLKGSPMAMVKAQQEAEANYNTAMEDYNAQVAAAEENLNAWSRINSLMNDRKRAIREQQEAERKVREEKLHAEAVAEAQAEYEARKQAEAERKAVGNENPMPAITEKWNNATKVDGHRDEIMLPDGTPLKGHYVLHESGASSPSHNPETWQKTDGFPMDANDNSVNDRDYERDHDAQEHTQSIARQYDQRALQSVPVVSNDGVVLSGNGRTMAGELAARDNTDGAYVNYLKEYAPKFGFTPEQVGAMQHPRVSFVPDEAMPYTAETFAKFNQQEMKSQNKTEQAVKLGKTVSDDSFKRIVRAINGYDTLGDFYNDAEASLGAVYDLHNVGVVPQAQLAEMVDGVRGQEKLSAVGREFLENMLIGKAFESDPEVVRMLTAEPAMRQTVITALGEIVDNIALGGDWSLQGELADAVKLCFDARQGGAKYGEIVSTYARQGVLFAAPDELQTVADFNNATMLMLADVLNDKRVTLLKIAIQLYNDKARQSAAGQADLFAGGILSREDILREVINFIKKNYGKGKEIEAARAAAVERRKAESVQQDGTPPAVNGGSENTRGSGRNETAVSAELRITDPRTMSDEERQRRGEMLRNATAIDVAPNHIVSTKDKTARKAAEEWWDDNVGDAQWYETEAGEVEINRNSIESSLAHGYGQMKLDAITSLVDGFSNAVYLGTMPDSTRQDGVLNHYFAYPINYKGKRSYVFCRALHDNNTNRLYVHEVFVEDKIKKGNTLQTAASQPHGGISLYRDILANVLLSDGEESENSATVQEKTVKVAENQEPNAVQAALAAAEQETNTEPTEAQKEAGNYKKGHVRIDGFDVTIENPKGSVRRGTDASGKQWEQEMQNTYGYIRGTEGVDGDHIDVFFSEDPSQGDVFVVDQVNGDGSFDEHKVMYGFPDIESARKAYLSNYEDGWQGLGAITPVSKEEFKKWIDSSHRKTKPFAEYSSVKAITEDVDQRRTNVNKEGLVVDAEGNPLTLYHGTPNDVEFGSLESGHVRDGEETPARFNGNGISFTPDRTVATEYATSEGGKGKVFEVNVTLKKPYFTVGVANFTPEEAAAFTDGLIAKGYDGIINYSSKWMRDAGALPSEVIVFDINGVRQNGDVKGKTDSQGKPLSDDEVTAVIDAMKAHATVAPEIEITDENWKDNIETPIGNVRMGAHQKEKLFAKGRESQYGMLVETLSNPDIVLEEKDKTENLFHERPSSYLFVKTFQKEDGSKYVHFESVTVSQKGMEVSVSSHIIRENQLKNKVKNDRLLYKATALDAPAITSAEQPIKGGSLSSKRQATNNGGELIVLSPKDKVENLPTPLSDLSSAGKVRNASASDQENGVKNGGVEDYVSMAERRVLEEEAKRNAAGFATETPDEAAAFDKRVPEMNNAELLAYIQADGNGDVNKAHHPNVYDEYDNRHGDEIMAAHDWYLDSLRENVTTLEQAEEMLANIHRDKSLLATDSRAELLGQEEALQDYIVELENREDKQVRQQKGAGASGVSSGEAALRDALVDVLSGAGVEVVTDAEEGQRVLDEANGETRLHAKKRALETVSSSRDERYQQTVVSSADGAKVLNHLDKLVSDYEENEKTHEKTFIGTVANALGAKSHNSKSEYATFETKNGRVVTIRLADHNATVSNFDNRGELDGISIVVSPKKSAGVTNDGDAHVVEYYYDAIKLRKADGKPLADIVRSIKQALYSGEFEDTTGLAERQEVNAAGIRFFRTSDGHAYGFTKDGKIYIDPRIATAETPIHEYSHLWASAFRKANPEEWANIVELMKGTTLWEEVMQRYPELKTEDEIADEVLAQYSGRRGAERLRAEQEKIAKGDGDVFEKAEAISALNRVRDALKRFWKGVADWFGIHFTSAEEVADKVLSDLLHGVNPAFAVKDGGVRYEANSEEAGIVARAKAEGTYMKAPNGKPSRLTPRQWVQVRTRAFKEWFGDWEKAARVLEVIPALKEHGFKNFDEAKAWAKEHIVRTLTDAETGGKGEIRISNNAVAKFLSESAVAKSDSKDVHLSVLKVLPDVIRESVDAEQHPDYKKGEDGSRSVGNGVNEHVTIHRLYGAVNIDGKTYRVKVTLKEDRTNNEPQKAYSYEATKIELLAGQHEEAVTSSRNSNNSITAANLLQDIEKSYGNGEKLLDCSKVVDENGEPRVVYHQTNSTIFVNRKTGENFENLGWKEKDYWQNEASEEEWNDTWEEQDFYSFDNKTHGRRSVEMPAFFFSPVYDEYHEYGDRTVEAFLNIRNPIVNPDIPNRGVTDTAGEDAMKALIERGYDGFIREYDGEVEEINAFFPSQIKSAEENVGTFDGENPDIRYQFVGEKGAAAMDKAEEANVRLDNLAVAREMEASGKDAKAVKLATGWERGGDGKWRYEIEDFDSSGLENLVREDNKKKLRLSEHRRTLLGRKWEMESEVYPDRYFDEFSDAEREQWDREHTAEIAELNDLSKEIDRLKKQEESSSIYTDLGTVVGKDHVMFKYYPELEGAVVHITDMPSSVGGNYKPGVITLNRGALYDSSILNHEVQHAIQEIEGFARGGSVSDVRKRIMKRISELDGVSEYAKEMLARQVEYQALASKLGYVYERLMKNGEDWAVRAASDNYWEAMNTLDNDENSTLENAYPKGKNASEIAKEGFNREKAIEELKRLSDYYASQISAEDMRNIKASEALSGKMDGKSDEELYLALGGEVEARNVQSRLGMTAAERRRSLASETEDVAREDQIFLEDGFGVSMSASASETDLENVNRRFNEELKTHRDYNRFVPQVRRELEKMGYRFELDGKELTPEESLALDKQNWESRDVIPGREGHTPFVSNEDIARINAKMAGKWVGEPKEAMESAMSERVTELSERLHTPVRIIRTEEELAALPSVRQRRMKGSFNPMTGEVTIVVPNNANMADVENTFVHEVVGHDGLRVLFPDEAKLNNALDELYRVSKDEIRGTIDRMAQKMYDAEVDRIREKKRKEHEARGEDVNASYYADMAEAHAEASKKREQFKRDATEEYGADLAGRIGEKGFEQMSAEELTFWGKLKAMLQKALQKLLDGLKIPGRRKWADKDWAFVLHEAYKRKKNGGKPTVFDAADTEVMRRKTGFGNMRLGEDRGSGSSRSYGGLDVEAVNERFNEQLGTLTEKNADSVVFSLGRPSVVLQSAGVKNKPMKLYGNKVMKKMRKHGFALEELRDLPRAVADPIAVFNNYGEDGNRSILTELRTQQGNFLVSVNIGKDADVDFNIVRSVFGKGDENVVDWINKGLATYINKEKALSFLSHQSAPIAATAANAGQSSESLSSASQPVQQEIDKQVLDTATKVVKDFVNPKVSDENVADEGIMFRDGDMGLEETITKMKVEASQANADNWQAKQDAMRAIGGNLNKLRQAMARQREYDLSTVKSITDLAKVLLENGLLDDLSKYETKRILSAVNNVHGKQDVSDYVQKVMDIMVDNQLRMGANQLGKLLSIRGSRVDARGIEVQGQLDPEGQRIAQVVRKATSLPKENIEERIADCTNRMSSDDNAVAEEAAIEYSGLLLAHQFVEDITESKAEEKALRESIKESKADLDAGTMEADAYREYVESTNDAIRQNKIERAEAYRSIVEQVGGVLGGSVERAKAWREAEKQRVETIHHNANSDMTGRPNDEHHKESKAQKIANNSIVRFVLAPLGTFDQMLRMFGKKSVNGEGYLWNRYMRGWVEATEKEYTGYQNALKTLDEKVSDVFGKKMKWVDLFSFERNLPKATVTFWDGGEQKAHELTQGNLLYIYMVDKMADGRMKLRRMGITEEDVEKIKEFVDPRFLELADWMQDEFLVEKRNEYNEVHKRMFGASMAAIENYFPLKILANARIEEVDVADDTTDTSLPATSTGSIIKRRRNNLALDVMGADAFSVILDHIQQMERWASFAEFNRDLNTLLSYKRFRNQVMNMTSVYGGGKTLWKNFRNVCSMAAGAYRPPIAALDKAAVNVAKGVTAAKVSFRVFTALKQFLSMPAYLSDSSPVYLAGNIANPIGAWKWSMENLPLFEKRWKSRMAGDPRLMKSEMDWKMWQNRAVEIASRIGMSPNAFVDALTVAIGAHSMYQTKKKKYLRYGYDEETAEKRAKQDATILFNQTQQSSESAFLSTMQVDRSWETVMFSVFRNSPMAYTRMLYNALRNLKHRFEPGYKGLSEEFMAKQMRRDGIDPDKADRNAKSEYRRALLHDMVTVGVFGYLLQLAWNLGAYLPYLLLGDDKDEKSDMWDDAFKHSFFGSIEGLTGGDVMSAIGNDLIHDKGLNPFTASKDMPLSSDLQNIVNKWNKDKVAAMNDVTNLMVQSGIGVNPQSLTDAVVAIMDYCGDDANSSRECALLITRIINCPQSQIDKIYFDELNATAAEAQGMTPAEIAERYARYKMHRGAPLTGWAYTDEARDSVMTAQQNRVLTKAKEKLNSRMETEETKQLLSDYDAVAKQETALSKIKKTDRAAYREGMKQLRQSNDMRQHMRLKRYKHDMNELTSKYLRCKSAEERDSIVSTMFSTRAKMLEDIGRLKQQ